MSLRPCGPLALIPVNGEKTKTGAKSGPKNDCSARPFGRRVMILVGESCILVDHTGHSASVLRDSAVYRYEVECVTDVPIGCILNR